MMSLFSIGTTMTGLLYLINRLRPCKTLDGDKTINNISLKNKNNEELSKSEIGDLRILTFMKSKRSPKELLIKSIELTRHAKMNETECKNE